MNRLLGKRNYINHSPIQIVDTHAKDTRIAEAGESGGHELRAINENGDND